MTLKSRLIKYSLIGIAIAIIFIILKSLFVSTMPESSGNNKIAHLSIDDVESFKDLHLNADKYDTLFDHPFFGYLHSLHCKYGAKFTLYTYSTIDSFNIKDLSLKYKKDFRNSASWLKIGYHWISKDFNHDITVCDFNDSYRNVCEAIYNFADSSNLSTTLRLHYFYAPDSLVKCLTKCTKLLCADQKGRLSYNLTPSQADSVYNYQILLKDSIYYMRTDFRIVNHTYIIPHLRNCKNDTIVIFTHEWALFSNKNIIKKHINRYNLEASIQWLKKNQYNFIF